MRSRYCVNCRISGSIWRRLYRQLRVVFEIAPHEMIGAGTGFQSDGASIIGRSDAILLGQREYAQNAADSSLAFRSVHGLAQRANMRSGYFGSTQQLFG